MQSTTTPEVLEFRHPSIPADARFVPGRVAILGLGLIGGSFAKALHEGGTEVYAWNRTRSTLDLAMIECVDGVLDETSVDTCELIILAGYPQVSIEWLRSMAPSISPGAIVIDIAGVKRRICKECFAIAKERPWTFVGCHPMAGTQYSGFAHTRANMFHRAPMVVVPPRDMDDFCRLDVLERLKTLLEPCGFGMFTLSTPEHHDEMIAFTSQIAHVLACSYVLSPLAPMHAGYSAGSYRDVSRVARINAEMWTQLFLDNKEPLVREIDDLVSNLMRFKYNIVNGDGNALTALMKEGNRIKEEIG